MNSKETRKERLARILQLSVEEIQQIEENIAYEMFNSKIQEMVRDKLFAVVNKVITPEEVKSE